MSAAIERLRLLPQEGTTQDDHGNFGRVDFYPSSMTRNGEPLLSLISLGDGLRLTREQATELRDFLGAWLDG